jgi:hypothetical protein
VPRSLLRDRQVMASNDDANFRSPIATRYLARADTGAAVTMQLGRPRRRRTGEFECPYRVRGLGRIRIGRALGEDGVQSLQLAFEAVRLELEHHAAILTWYGELGETGFPQYVPYMFGGRFRKRLEAMVNRAIEREARRLEQRSKVKRVSAAGHWCRGTGIGIFRIWCENSDHPTMDRRARRIGQLTPSV